MSNSTQAHSSKPTPAWRRYWAYCWYAWGISLSHWGLRTRDDSFWRAALGSFDRATRIWPDFARGYYRRGIIRGRELGEHQQGIADLTSATQIAPDWPDPYLQRGLLRRFHGDQDGAVEDLRRYLELDRSSQWRAEAERQLEQIIAETEHHE